MDDQMKDAWERIAADADLAGARRKLSIHELRTIIRHAMEALEQPPGPSGQIVPLFAADVPFSSVVGGGLTLKTIDGRAAFIVNFMGTTQGITKEESVALSDQFRWFVQMYGIAVPKRADAA